MARLLELAASTQTSPHSDGARSAPRHNLPIPLTSFVGREREMAEVERWLSRSPLVTLTGAGGCGKTRLALQVAADLAPQYPDGVWLVELAPLSDPALVPYKVASTLGVREELGHTLVTTLANHLREKGLLLVLDNCEHVIDACAQLVEALLRTCSDLRILATSREVIGLAGETAWRVHPLSLPPIGPRVLPPIEDFTQYEAVQRFVDRARTALPGFTVTKQNAPAVVQACHQLDGMPLAIELAAARVATLRVGQIAARLDHRFNLLTGGSRTALPRHQTLQAAIDWSYDLLSEAERAMLGRLSVFVGGWTLAAAESVCAGDGVAQEVVLDLLTQLVNKSLVTAQRAAGQEARYRLLETIREYALARLSARGAEAVASVRRRHASFFLALVEAVKPMEATRGVWLEQFMGEHDNLRAALDWAFESAPDLGSRLAGALRPFWFHAGYLSEGRVYLMRALELTEARRFPKIRAEVLASAAGLAWQQGDYAAARSLFEESMMLYREVEDQQGLAGRLVLLGRMMVVLQGPHAAARSLQEEGVGILRALGDKYDLAVALSFLGASVAAQGDDAAARSLQEESAALFRECDPKGDLATPLGYLGYLALRQGDFGAARLLFGESLTLRWARMRTRLRKCGHLAASRNASI